MIDYYGLNMSQFEQKISVSNGTIRSAIARNRGLNSDVLIKILEVNHEISPDWLLLGKGKMLRENCKKAPNRPIQTEDERQASNVAEEQLSFSRPSLAHLSPDSNPSWERYNDALIEIGSLRERLAQASVTIATLTKQLAEQKEKANSTSAPTPTEPILV